MKRLPDSSVSRAHCHLLRLGLPFADHQRNIVGGSRALSKLCQCRLDSIAYACGRGVNVARDHLVKSRRTKLFARRTLCFSHTVRIDAQDVTALQLRAPFPVLSIRLDTERKTSGRKLLDGSRRMNNQWRIVSGVEKGKCARLWIQFRIDQGYKPIPSNIIRG